jgi:hypothetical protein
MYLLTYCVTFSYINFDSDSPEAGKTAQQGNHISLVASEETLDRLQLAEAVSKPNVISGWWGEILPNNCAGREWTARNQTRTSAKWTVSARLSESIAIVVEKT